MHKVVSELLEKLACPTMIDTDVIPWGSPIPLFGDISKATIATLGINPSNREFVDVEGRELRGSMRRFHTLRSLGLKRWSEARRSDFDHISETYRSYFRRNPYDAWFKKLDAILRGIGASYYSEDSGSAAVHLDIVPYATKRKWGDLSVCQRKALFGAGAGTLGELVRASSIRALVLNGQSVVMGFQALANVNLMRDQKREWALKRLSRDVPGYAFRGAVDTLGGVPLGRRVTVLGYNHNIQSSFGVTRALMRSIEMWLKASLCEAHI